MEFYDRFIQKIEDMVMYFPKQTFSPGIPWRDLENQQIILKRDTAFQLEGVGFNLVTSSVVQDRIILVGDDLNHIYEDRRFARIALVQVQDAADGRDEYDLIKKIDYVKYHTFPDGYMMRSTSRSHQEAVRVSKTAVNNGVDFQKIGSIWIAKYKQIPEVKGVTLIFITAPNADYQQIQRIAEKSHAVTETLNRVTNDMVLDCSVCNLKPICDEVEGIKNLHFGRLSSN